MGGGAMHIDLPFIHVRNPSSSSSNGENKSKNSFNLPVSPSHVGGVKPSCSASYCFCGSESTCGKLEVAVNEKQDKRAPVSLLTSVFGPVPSQFEVENALAALLSFVEGIISPRSEFQMLQQMVDLCVPKHRRVYDAFQLLQTDPSIKRLVISLASDKALWDAITNNELVKKLRQPLFSGLPQSSSNNEPDLATWIMRRIMDIIKAKVMELIEQFQSLVNEIFLPRETERENSTADNKDQFEEKLRSSLLLSVVILLIVVVTRFRSA